MLFNAAGGKWFAVRLPTDTIYISIGLYALQRSREVKKLTEKRQKKQQVFVVQFTGLIFR